MTTHYQKIQALGNRMASNLETMGVSASFNDGGLTLADKILQIQHFTDGLTLYADKSIAQSSDTVNLYALLLNNGKPVSGETVIFSGAGTVRNETYSGNSYVVYTVFGDGELNCAAGQWILVQGEYSASGESFQANSIKVTESELFIRDIPASEFNIDYDPTQPLEIWVDSTVTSNTFSLVESATTGTNGVATFQYTCTGAGLKTITAESGSVVSQPYPIMDAKFYDSAILNDPQINNTYYKSNSNYERFSDGTLITATGSSNGYLMIDETGDTKPFNEELCFECDIVTSSSNNNGFFVVGTNNTLIKTNSTTTGYHVKLEVKTTGILLTIDDNTPVPYNAVTGNYDIRFIVATGQTIKFKNAVLYPI